MTRALRVGDVVTPARGVDGRHGLVDWAGRVLDATSPTDLGKQFVGVRWRTPTGGYQRLAQVNRADALVVVQAVDESSE